MRLLRSLVFICASPALTLLLVSCGGSSAPGVTPPAARSTFSEFALPSNVALESPGSIALGSDGNLWFDASLAHNGTQGSVWKISTAGLPTQEYSDVKSNFVAFPAVITSGPDGGLWFPVLSDSGPIARLSTAGGIRVYPLGVQTSVTALTSGSDGAIWFADKGKHAIGRVTPAGAFTEFQIPTAGNESDGIALGPDGALWFTDFTSGTAGNTSNAAIGRMTTTGSCTTFPLPTAGAAPGNITAGPDGALWFTEVGRNRIGRITTAGAISEYALPGPNPASSITSGPAGALWFVTSLSAQLNPTSIGRITTAGAVSEFALPPSYSAVGGIAASPDGSLWITAYNSSSAGFTSAILQYHP